MNIYNINTIESDQGTRYVIETDDLKSINISDIEDKIDMEVYNDNDYLALSGTKIDQAKMTLDQGISLSGDDYSFNAYVGTEEINKDENGLVRVSAKSSSDVRITKNKNDVNVSTDKKLSQITTAKYVDSKITEDKVSDCSNLSISAETTETDTKKTESTKPTAPKKSVSKGDKIKVGKNIYNVLSTKTKSVEFLKTTSNQKTITIPATVKIQGKMYQVCKIAAKALKGSKRARTLNIKSTKLTAKGVRNSLKGSKIVTVKLSSGAKKKKKLYKKIFAKKNCGKKVKIK